MKRERQEVEQTTRPEGRHWRIKLWVPFRGAITTTPREIVHAEGWLELLFGSGAPAARGWHRGRIHADRPGFAGGFPAAPRVAKKGSDRVAGLLEQAFGGERA